MMRACSSANISPANRHQRLFDLWENAAMESLIGAHLLSKLKTFQFLQKCSFNSVQWSSLWSQSCGETEPGAPAAAEKCIYLSKS